MGQYGSRAALISSGAYLSAKLPAALTGESDYYRICIQPAIYEFLQHGEGSAMSQPSTRR